MADATRASAIPSAAGALNMLSDAELIGRFKVLLALEQALQVPGARAGVHAAIAGAARHNDAEMLDLLDDLVRRVVQRGPVAQR